MKIFKWDFCFLNLKFLWEWKNFYSCVHNETKKFDYSCFEKILTALTFYTNKILEFLTRKLSEKVSGGPLKKFKISIEPAWSLFGMIRIFKTNYQKMPKTFYWFETFFPQKRKSLFVRVRGRNSCFFSELTF